MIAAAPQRVGVLIAVVGLLAGSLALGCSTPVGEDGKAGKDEAAGGTARALSVADVHRESDTLVGTTVEVQGRFMGWSGCRDATVMTTRSDWVLRDDAACIFVTGGLPPRLDPADRSQRGVRVRIRAVVLTSDDSVYLRLQ